MVFSERLKIPPPLNQFLSLNLPMMSVEDWTGDHVLWKILPNPELDQEDVHMVKCSHQADMFWEQHTIAENVARHITNTDIGEILRLSVDTHFLEMALNRNQPPFAVMPIFLWSWHRHRWQSVRQPETIFFRNAIGDISECCAMPLSAQPQMGSSQSRQTTSFRRTIFAVQDDCRSHQIPRRKVL